MIVGTIALITLLFLGGSVPDYFLVTGLDKAVKEYVIDKERKKEILAELKLAKKEIIANDKKRDALIKALKQTSADFNAGQSELIPFGDSLMENMTDYQELVIRTRITLIQKIKDEEWEKIVTFSKDKVKKNKEKLQQKIDKGKVNDPFEKLQSSLQSQIIDEDKKKGALTSLETFKGQFNNMANKLTERNVIDTPILSKKSSSKEELTEIADEVNVIRMETFNHMMEFRNDLKNYTNEEEWNKVIKEFNKIWK